MVPKAYMNREIASSLETNDFSFEMVFTQNEVFANGADAVFLKLKIKDSQGKEILVNPTDIQLYGDSPFKSDRFFFQNGYYFSKIQPSVKSPNIKIFVTWKDEISPIIELKTTLAPIKEKMIPIKSNSGITKFISGLSYQRQENFPENNFEQFSIDNNGKNQIVTAEESSRSFEFEFEEQAVQNISLMVSDAPNGTVSHTMHSHFMFFPRLFLPFAEFTNGDVKVTIPTGEEILFSETGEIREGIFEEGPVDIGPDRFKRHYADLKYLGKGIVLRANARGQMPQQGQFETTKIDLDYGIKNSFDVLIINGTTGQRCRRPKIDFWSSDDVSPILFKFSNDSDFEQYLKEKCGFGIPDLSAKDKRMNKPETGPVVQRIWKKCETENDISDCIETQANQLQETEKFKAIFELIQILVKEKKREKDSLPLLIRNEIPSIQLKLLSDVSWLSNFSQEEKMAKDCLAQVRTLNSLRLRFHEADKVMQNELNHLCFSIKSEINRLILREIPGIKSSIEKDFNWLTLSLSASFNEECRVFASRALNNENRFQNNPKIYQDYFSDLCQEIESSAPYTSWLKSQSMKFEVLAIEKILIQLEERGNKKAQQCVVLYPMRSQIEKIRFKKDREDCLIKDWAILEDEVLKDVQKEPILKKISLPFEHLDLALSAQRRKIQLSLMKKYFF
jgi:hypothetical protein